MVYINLAAIYVRVVCMYATSSVCDEQGPVFMFPCLAQLLLPSICIHICIYICIHIHTYMYVSLLEVVYECISTLSVKVLWSNHEVQPSPFMVKMWSRPCWASWLRQKTLTDSYLYICIRLLGAASRGIDVCMYVCMHTYMYIYIYTCTHIYMYIHTHIMTHRYRLLAEFCITYTRKTNSYTCAGSQCLHQWCAEYFGERWEVQCCQMVALYQQDCMYAFRLVYLCVYIYVVMYICVYVCICVCMYVCYMYVYVYVCMFVCVYVCRMYVCMHACIHAHA